MLGAAHYVLHGDARVRARARARSAKLQISVSVLYKGAKIKKFAFSLLYGAVRVRNMAQTTQRDAADPRVVGFPFYDVK